MKYSAILLIFGIMVFSSSCSEMQEEENNQNKAMDAIVSDTARLKKVRAIMVKMSGVLEKPEKQEQEQQIVPEKPLSPEEKETLALLAQGYSQQDISLRKIFLKQWREEQLEENKRQKERDLYKAKRLCEINGSTIYVLEYNEKEYIVTVPNSKNLH